MARHTNSSHSPRRSELPSDRCAAFSSSSSGSGVLAGGAALAQGQGGQDAYELQEPRSPRPRCCACPPTRAACASRARPSASCRRPAPSSACCGSRPTAREAARLTGVPRAASATIRLTGAAHRGARGRHDARRPGRPRRRAATGAAAPRRPAARHAEAEAEPAPKSTPRPSPRRAVESAAATTAS